MATYQFGALSDGQALAFNATADVLNFDQSAIAAADIRVTASGTSTRIDVIAGPQAGKDIVLLNTAPFQLAGSNVTFANGSLLRFGDNSTAAGDDNGNTLAGGAGRDLISSFGGSDTINIGSASFGAGDYIDGGAGFDTLNFNGYVTAALTIDFAAGSVTSASGSATFANIERLIGGAGNDSIAGDAAGQNLTSAAGNDTLWGAGGVDTLWSGAGADVFLFREMGSANADIIGDFTSGADRIVLDGAVLSGLGASGSFAAGDARFWAAAGASSGHDADDRIVYNSSTRQLFYDADGSGAGAAQLLATLQSGTTLLATDIEVLGAGVPPPPPPPAPIVGTEGNDSLLGTSGNDTIEGRGGNDTLDGAAGRDTLDGGAGADSFRIAEAPDQYVAFESGIDKLRFDGRTFTQLGLSGNFAAGDERFHAAPGAASGHDATDRLIYDTSTGRLYYDPDGSGAAAPIPIADLYDRAGAPSVLAAGDIAVDNGSAPPPSGGQIINGTAAGETLAGTAGNDIINGLGGSDTINIGAPSFGIGDAIDGGAGFDTLNFSGYVTAALTVDFAAGTIASSAGSATVTGIERLIGGAGNDSIAGEAAGQNLTSVGGNDTLWGAGGVDTLWSGTGADVFLFREVGTANADTIGDFTSGADRIVLDGAVLSGLGAAGTFAAADARFWAAAGATGGHDADDRVVYNTTTRQLFYDADGSGAGAAQLIATLQSGATLAATDIEILGSSVPPPPAPIVGTQGNDSLLGTSGNDTIEGRGGNDTLDGAAGADSLDGGAGADLYVVDNAGDVVVEQQSGDVDTVSATVSYTLGAWVENLTLTGSAPINGTGTALDNVLTGNSAANTLDGGLGNDTYHVGAGDVLLDSGGTDSVVTNVTWILGSGLENLTLTGAATIDGRGNALANVIQGNAAANILEGSAGNDTLTGGAGADAFVFRESGTGNADTIGDFVSGADRIVLDGTVLPGLGAAGVFGPGDARFVANSTGTAQDASDRVVYNTTTRQLYYDVDGSGAGAAVLLATLQSGATIAATDIETIGTSAPVPIVGTEGNDSLVGTSGNDTIEGRGGNDTLDGAAGADTLDGGTGADLYLADNAGDLVVEQQSGGIDTVSATASYALGSWVENLILTGSAPINATGNELANVLTGNGAANVLDGGLGNDTYHVGAGDMVFDAGGADTVLSDVTWTLGAAFEHLMLTGSAAIDGTGNALANSIQGNAAANVLDGGAGADSMDGGLGNDTYHVGSGDVLLDAGGTDTVRSEVTWTLGAAFEHLTLTGSATIDGIGNALANSMQGNGAANVLDGGAGADTIDGGAGADVYFVDDVGDVVLELQTGGIDSVNASLSYTLGSWVENLTLIGGAAINATGNALANSMQGNGAANVLEGGAGNDALSGGAGADAFLFRESGTGNADTIGDFVSGADRIVLDGTVLSGLGAAGVFAAGDARFFAAAGASAGQDASDRLIYDTSSARLYYDADGNGAGAAQLLATLQSGAALLATDIEVVGASGPTPIVGTEGNDSLVGTSGNDTIEGRGGNDTLDGAAGADIMDGGAGADVYFIENPGDVALEVQNGGIDSVNASLSYALGAWVENLTLTGSAPINGTGNALDNVLNGNGAANVLDGGLGNDTYQAGAGDVLLDAGGTDTVVSDVTWTLGVGFENLTLSGAAAIEAHGNALANVLQGNSAANVLEGGAGNDALNGGAGTDAFLFRESGTGNADTIGDFVSGADRIVLDGAVLPGLGVPGVFSPGDARFVANSTGTAQDTSDRVVYNTTTRQLYYDVDGSGAGAAVLLATLQSGATLAATDIETIGTSAPVPIVGTEGNDSLVGTSGNDTIEGRGGNDTLDGAAGADTLDGGTGADLYLVDNAGDLVVEQQSGGIDTVSATVSYALGSWVENLTLTGSAPVNATGNELDNVLIGNSAANSLNGGLGNDTYHVGAGDVLLDAGGSDTVASDVSWILGAGFENLTLTGAAAIDGRGNALANAIQGNAAANVLEGGAGNDTLNGGGGADAFFFRESGAANADTIGDFASATDRVVLDGAVLSNLGAPGTFAAGDARFWAAAGAIGGHDADDRVVYDTSTGNLYYDADGSGAAAAQLIATLQAGPALAANDIVVQGEAPPSGDVRAVVQNGPSGNRIDIVILGDGYTTAQLATDYRSDVDALVERIFADSALSQPLGRYESFFNVYAVDVASNESGADHPGVTRDTALGAHYVGAASLDIDEAAASAALAAALQGTGIQAEMRFVAVNDPAYGGSGGSFAVYSAANAWAGEIALHEAGHSFADLADQYWTAGQRYAGPEPEHPDVTVDAAGAKWSRWLGYDDPEVPAVGVFEGGFTYETGIYRPSDTSKMLALGQPFDAVGREAFILRFYQLVDPLDGHLGNAQTLSNADELWVDTIDPQIIRVDWTINGTTYADAGERISLSALGLSNGDYTVTARAYDPTEWVRVADRSSLEQTVQWRVINDASARILGTAGNDMLAGSAGNDSLDGGLGADTMAGGLGNDVYVVTVGDVVSDMGGIDTAYSDISWSLADASGLDNLILTGTAATAGQGNSGDNRLSGNGAANTLEGLAGNDTLSGGAGDDVVRVDLTTMTAYGNDRVDGGSGTDALVFVGQRSATTLDLRARTLNGGGQAAAGSIALWSIESFVLPVDADFADRVIGGDAAIQASTGAGNDTLVGGAGADVFQGGSGADSFVFVRASAVADTIADFASGQDRLEFDSAAFAAIGPAGQFAPGDARFWAVAGASGGHDADDRVVYDTSSGRLYYDPDGSGSAPAQLVATFSGNAPIEATDVVVRVNGTSGRDTLDGGSSDDELHGGAGQDFFRFRLGTGDYGHDVIDGGPGVDHLDFTGYAQSAVVVDLGAGTLQGGGSGGSGSASLESIEAVRGGGFDDLLIAAEASEFGGAAFSGGGGNDTLVGGMSRDALWGDAGNDQLLGNGGHDQLDGGPGADQIFAGAGDDVILVYDFEPAVIDRIEGGPGRDQVQFHAARASLAVNLSTGTATVGTSTFMLADVEDIIGPDYASLMTGSAAGNFLAGGGGADTLQGGSGNDTLWGGGGADSFVFAEAPGSANADRLADFTPGADRIRLDDAAFVNIGAMGNFALGDARFAAGSGFTAGRDASDRVVYDTATGNLYYDADGSGAGAAQLIATFTGNPAIAATDIVVI